MSADETFGAPIVEQIDGHEVSFPRLYMDFYGTLEASVRSHRTGVIESACDASQVTGKDRVAFIRDAAMQPIMVEDVDLYLCTEAGSRKTIEKSLETAGVNQADRKAVVGKLTAPDATFLARRIVGFLREQPSGEETVEQRGAPKARDWDGEYALCSKHIPGFDAKKLTWHQYNLCVARAQASERAANPEQ